jgi:DNA-binding beta-propeller fold protein YncE
MRTARLITGAALVLIMAACGSHQEHHRGQADRATAKASSPPVRPTQPKATLPPPQALVTAETENQLLVVDLPSGRIVHRVTLPADPEDLAATGYGGVVVVVSARAGRVTVLNRDTLRPIRAFGGFDEPHIAAISPDDSYAYITDDARGTLTVIRLSDMRVTSTVAVGLGAHHLSFSPDEHQVWVGLGESAHRISILDTTDPNRPRLIGGFSPGFPAHDLSFSPDGTRVWITSAAGPDVTAFDARTHRPLFRVRVGAPPQHIAFDGRYAYLTSGYGSVIARVDTATGRVISRARAPYGSFELAAADGYVAVSSLLRGTLAIYNSGLRLVRVVRLAPADREVAISRP